MAKIKEAIEDFRPDSRLVDERAADERKGIMFWMHARDREIIDRMKARYGCTTTAAIRACIRIADEVKLKLEHEAPTNAG